jgi:hypothetical protein
MAWLWVSPFCALSVAVDLDDGGVDHGVFHVGIVGVGVKQPSPDIRLHPVAEAREYAVQWPNEGGRSRQGLPVRAIHSTASTNCRFVLAAAPGIARLAKTVNRRGVPTPIAMLSC